MKLICKRVLIYVEEEVEPMTFNKSIPSLIPVRHTDDHQNWTADVYKASQASLQTARFGHETLSFFICKAIHFWPQSMQCDSLLSEQTRFSRNWNVEHSMKSIPMYTEWVYWIFFLRTENKHRHRENTTKKSLFKSRQSGKFASGKNGFDNDENWCVEEQKESFQTAWFYFHIFEKYFRRNMLLVERNKKLFLTHFIWIGVYDGYVQSWTVQVWSLPSEQYVSVFIYCDSYREGFMFCCSWQKYFKPFS